MASAAFCQTLCLSVRPAPARALSYRRCSVQRLAPVCSAGKGVDLGGEQWEVVESLASNDDVLLYYNHQVEEKHSNLGQVMKTNLITTTAEATLADVAPLLESIEGLPVVDDAGKLVGVISKKDFSKGGTLVKDVMSSPAVSLKVSSPVGEAATLMVERKFHRVPVVDDDDKCVGIVTRTDIFWALAMSVDEDDEAPFAQHGIVL